MQLLKLAAYQIYDTVCKQAGIYWYDVTYNVGDMTGLYQLVTQLRLLTCSFNFMMSVTEWCNSARTQADGNLLSFLVMSSHKSCARTQTYLC